MTRHINRRPLGDHDVGYCRPPRRRPASATKSTSAQPRGIGTRQVMIDFFEPLEEIITVNQGGKKRRMPAGKVVYRQLVAKAVKGEAWAIRRITDLQLRLLDMYDSDMERAHEVLANIEHAEKKSKTPLTPEAKALKEELLRRVANWGGELFEKN